MTRAPHVAPVVADELRAIDDALVRLLRWGNLPRVRAAFEARSGVRIDRAGAAMLALLEEHGPLRLSAIAALTGVDTSTASRQVGALERLGVAARAPDPRDGRAAMFSATSEGHDALARLRAARREFVAELLATWPPGDRARLATLLARLADDLVSVTSDAT